MFHGKHDLEDRLDRVEASIGCVLSVSQRGQLSEFVSWLATEAVAAGGIGPIEETGIADRHVADSLVFSLAWSKTPEDALDIGSGVGLPGIPLAVAYPATAFTLVDRSERRCDLARRAANILGLENVSIRRQDADRVVGFWSTILFRASLPPDRALLAALPRLKQDGCAVVGLSRLAEPETLPTAPPGTRLDIICTDPGVLDSPAWLLRMTISETLSEDEKPG